MVLNYIPKQKPIGPKVQNLKGKKFGKLTVLYRMQDNSTTAAMWYCKCDCGNYTKAKTNSLTSGNTSSCGCWNKERDRSYSHGPQLDMTGKIINNFKVIKQDLSHQSGAGKAKWWFVECPYCHQIFSIDGRNLRYGKQRSCGCIKSYGEFKITKLLLENNINFKSQYIFSDLPNRKFDFAIFNDENELQYLTQFDGSQHFDKKSRYYSEEGIKRDKQKNLYCLQHNIKLYRIPYTEETNLTFQKLTQPSFLVKEED